ncbi:OPT family oligopeptide transporter [Frateuria terrea]|uniref:Putative oligopeptide transporter, OPT family n=1 Tax=Frateuria terrea TaxID=529704 RepID=A0A1H6QFX9_9GAMM|nr:oligopeptide transporter, OPT family [Frateuria terrea]SEI38380.1 putative oligopeptide transporter, OPT family [Frateuria terrea]SFP03889.1 putative oligopeptide transporter, OPT family [Frateuria terrea]
MTVQTNSADRRTELTLRGVIIGVVITVVFTAANVFFGLKAGLTFATSIPAAVISMALLRGFKNSTIQENNVVQTIASAAGTLSSIIFVLPGMIMIGWWTGFPFWLSFAVCALGGVLGVMYSIPLRRALVTTSDLPYPEGVACAEVLKVGAGEIGSDPAEGRAGLLAVIWGAVVSAVFAIVVATQVFAADVASYFRLGNRGATSGFDFNLSFALFAIGHLVGLSVGIAMLVGAIIGWGWGVPYYSLLTHDVTTAAADLAQATWSHKVRFVGAGAIGVSAIWTLAKLVKPVISGLASAMAAARVRKAGKADTLPRTEQDIPIGLVGLVTLACFVPIAWLLGYFGSISGLGDHVAALAIGGVAYVVLMGFFVSTVCGYMAGLIGSSNSPLSGVGILVVIGAALLLVAGIKPHVSPDAGKALVAFALFITSVVFTVAAIANNNLQDLKTGQLVDATPWKQQVALVIGVIAGAAVIPPVLDLLNGAYGFVGVAGAGPHALPAPQAGLISALAQGVITGNIDWSLIRVGGMIGIAIIVLDEILARTTRHMRLPPLAVGLGIYLPTTSTLMVVVGSVVGWYFDRRADRTAKPETTRQLGVLLASGLIVGESVIGVAIAFIVGISGKPTPLGLVGPGFADAAIVIGGLAFAAVVFGMYRWVWRMAQTSEA